MGLSVCRANGSRAMAENVELDPHVKEGAPLRVMAGFRVGKIVRKTVAVKHFGNGFT